MPALAGIYTIDQEILNSYFKQMRNVLHSLFGSVNEKVLNMSNFSCVLNRPDNQLVFNKNDNSCLVFEGELFSLNDPMSLDQLMGQIEQLLNSAQFSALGKLNGMFCFVYWNKVNNTLILGRDHLGSYPLFYTNTKDRFIFSSTFQSLQKLSSIDNKPDYAGISHLINFGHWLGNHTYIEEIKSVPPGSVMVCKEGQIETIEYWKPEFKREPILKTNRFFDELYELWIQAVKQRIDGTTGLLLSGGVDSRMIAAALPTDRSIWALTYGIPEAWDHIFAKRIAKYTPISFNTLFLDESVMDDFKTDLETHYQYSEGFPGLLGTYLKTTSCHVSKHVSTVMEGAGGEVTRRSVYRRFANFNQNNLDFRHTFIQSNNQLRHFKNYFTEDFYSELEKSWDSSAHSIFNTTIPDCSIHDFLDLYYLKQRVRNGYSMGNNFEKNFIRCRLPFFDVDFIHAIMAIPEKIRKTGYVPIELIKRGNPLILNIPLSRGDLPLPITAGLLRTGWVQMRERILQKASNRFGFFGKFSRSKGMTDYPAWLRGAWKKDVNSLLNDHATFNTDWFNKRGIHAFINAFLEGKNSDISTLNNLLTLNWISQSINI